MISVCVPTIDGRESWLERCYQSYYDTTPDFEFIVERNWPTCNQGWNRAIEQAKGEYIHLSADDIEALPGWWEAACKSVGDGYLPAPRILNSDGTLQSCGDTDQEAPSGTRTELTRVPFFSRAQMEEFGIYPIIPTQYMGDNWVSHRARKHGCETVVVREMCFIHSFAGVGRLDHRLMDDVAYFRKAVAADR